MTSKSSSRTLTDHDEIRRWAEERGAKPASVSSTHSDDSIGIIRLDFPGYSGAGSLEEISWDEWFQDFDENNLALIVQDEMANGQKSNFNKLVSRESLDQYTGETSSEPGKKKKSRSGTQTRSKKAPGDGSKTAASSRRTSETKGSEKDAEHERSSRHKGKRAA